jgi:hypothetical protein
MKPKPRSRAQLDRDHTEDMQSQINEIHGRVFNGLGLELRKEIRDETNILHRKIGTLYKSVGGLLVALLLIFASIIIEGRVSSRQSSEENLRNYKAIVDVEKTLQMHMGATQ